MTLTATEEARAALDAAGSLPEDEIDLAAVALQLARIDAPAADWRAAEAVLSRIAQAAVRAATADRVADAGDAERRRQVLVRVLRDGFHLRGDSDSYEDVRNANLIHVLDRRRGMPVALGVLWLHAAQAAGWAAHGVDFPGHFLLALEGGRGQAVVDVFAGGAALAAPDLRTLLKRVQGDRAELKPGMLAAMPPRAVLLRLQNNIKLRRLRANDLDGALACAEDMLRIAPAQASLWREAGLMNHRLDRVGAALACLDRFLKLTPEGEAAARVRSLADEWRQRLH